MTDTETNALMQVVCDPRGRRLMLIQLMLCIAGNKDWKQDQIERLSATIDSIAEAFGLDAEKMLLSIGDARENKEEHDVSI